MGACYSAYLDDYEDRTIERLKKEREAREMAYFRSQLKKQRKECGFSQLDINGRGTSRDMGR